MKKNEGLYAIIIAILILSAFIVPYVFLSEIEKWYGSFLFWIVITVIVIFINYLFVKDWGKEK